MKNNWWLRLAEEYGHILLYCFMASILINPFILLAVGREKGAYTVAPEGIQPVLLPKNVFQVETPPYRTIDACEVKTIEENAWNIQVIGFTALLGWAATSKRFKAGMKRLIEKIKYEKTQER